MKSTKKINKVTKKKRYLLRKQISILVFLLFVSLIWSLLGIKLFFSLTSSPIQFFDQLFFALSLPLHTPQFDAAMVMTTKALSAFLVVYWVLISLFLYRKKKKSWSIFVITSAISTSIMAIVLETLFDRARPATMVLEHHLFDAYPSAHVMAFTILVVLASYMIFHFGHHFWRSVLSFDIGVCLIMLVGLQRIMVHAHYFSDVLGGLCFGISWSLLCIFFFRLYRFLSCNHS